MNGALSTAQADTRPVTQFHIWDMEVALNPEIARLKAPNRRFLVISVELPLYVRRTATARDHAHLISIIEHAIAFTHEQHIELQVAPREVNADTMASLHSLLPDRLFNWVSDSPPKWLS